MNSTSVQSEARMTESQHSTPAVAIKAKGLCKSYRKHYSATSRMADFANYLVSKRRSERYFELSHVLRDIDLTIYHGRSLGIIGRNGSGKSTFLKMVASIISQTSGELQVNGRVASIIELGAGFNPEDTGIQNIINYLTIYEIPTEAFPEKINQIVEFSGLGDKVWVPVKTYSSGMTVRLAFAIIAHLDADILLVDEALSVGDAVFAQKCMRFIKTFRQNGTILFVSHDLNSLQSFCDEVIWLHDGIIRLRGRAKPVCEAYLEFTLSADYPDLFSGNASGSSNNKSIEPSLNLITEFETKPPLSTIEIFSEPDLTQGFGGARAEILDTFLLMPNGGSHARLAGGEFVELHVRILAKTEIKSPIVGFLVKNSRGVEIFGENTLHDLEQEALRFEAGKEYLCVFSFVFPVIPSGDYTLTVTVADGDFYSHQQLVWRSDILVLRVVAARFRYGLIGVKGTSISVLEYTSDSNHLE